MNEILKHTNEDELWELLETLDYLAEKTTMQKEELLEYSTMLGGCDGM